MDQDISEFQWYLRTRDFFHGLDLQKRTFLALSQRKVFRRDDFIFNDGEAGRFVYYLQQGNVKICHNNRWGRETIIFIQQEGDIFGLSEAFNGSARVCNARALNECILYEMPVEHFEKLLSKNWKLAKRVLDVLGGRLRYLGKQLENITCYDVTTRLIRVLFCFGYKAVSDGEISGPIKVPVILTQQQLAAMIGSCQQTVSGILKHLQKDGLIRISTHPRELTILKPQELFRFMH